MLEDRGYTQHAFVIKASLKLISVSGIPTYLPNLPLEGSSTKFLCARTRYSTVMATGSQNYKHGCRKDTYG